MVLRSLIILAFLLTASVVFAEAPLGVRGGTEAFRQGDFQRAADAFAEAEKKDADDLRIAFNHGAALYAARKPDEAEASLRRAATAKETDVASKSLLLLGRMAVDRARQQLAPEPVETPPEQRQAVLDHLAAAEKYYAEASDVKPSDADRSNLEQIRAWRSRMTADWENFDRAQHRSDDVAKRLQWLEEWEEKLQKTVRETTEAENSPKKFQKFFETAKEQDNLAREIGAVRDEILDAVQSETETDAVGNAEEYPILQELDGLRNQAEAAGQALRNFKEEDAARLVSETARRLNRLRMNLAPYEMIVQEAEKRQAKLCETNPVRSQSEKSPAEQSREQQTISGWMPLMVDRAKQGLEQLENSEKKPNAPTDVMEPDRGHEGTNVPSPEQTEALKKSMELAVRHGPEIQELTAGAAQLLHETKPTEAVPKQDRALQLLREILEPLRQQQQNEQQDQKQNEQQNEQQQNSSSEQDEKQDEKQKNQQEEKQDGQDQQEQPEPQESPEPKEREEKQKESETKEEQEKAERMLRQVRRRQQEANEKREKIRALLLQLEPVEKDW